MRLLVLVVSLVALVGCAGAPVPEAPRPAPVPAETPAPPVRAIDLMVEDADIADLAEEIAQRVGVTIRVAEGVHPKVTCFLRRVPWRDVLAVVAALASCQVTEKDGTYLVDQPPDHVRVAFEGADLRIAIALVGQWLGLPVLVAADVSGEVTHDFTAELAGHDGPRLFHRFLAERALHEVRVGSVLVVAKAELDPYTTAPEPGESVRLRAVSAPAELWFDFIERVTGKQVSRGDAPVDVDLAGVSADEVLRASALASRVPAPANASAPTPSVATLASGRSVRYLVQATLTGVEHPVALVSGRYLEEGSEVEPGVRVARIHPDSLELVEVTAPGPNASPR